jgi:hypothetical protein
MPNVANDNSAPSRLRSAVQPRGLRRVDAARYIGISPTHFDKQVRAGIVPAPLQLFGVNVWDRAALDALFDGVLQAVNDNEWDSVLRHEEAEDLHLYTDRHGKQRIYLRKPGEKRIPHAGAAVLAGFLDIVPRLGG